MAKVVLEKSVGFERLSEQEKAELSKHFGLPFESLEAFRNYAKHEMPSRMIIPSSQFIEAGELPLVVDEWPVLYTPLIGGSYEVASLKVKT